MRSQKEQVEGEAIQCTREFRTLLVLNWRKFCVALALQNTVQSVMPNFTGMVYRCNVSSLQDDIFQNRPLSDLNAIIGLTDKRSKQVLYDVRRYQEICHTAAWFSNPITSILPL